MYKVIVAGSINMDVVARVRQHPAVGETVVGTDLAFYPGGKGANQAVAASRLGASTSMIGMLGSDVFSRDLLGFLGQENIDLSLVGTTTDAHTGAALIAVGSNSDNTIIVVPGANHLLTPEHVEDCPLKKGDIVLSQFEIPELTIEALFRRAKESGATTVLNSAPAKYFSSDLVAVTDIWVMNESELAFYSGECIAESPTKEHVSEVARRVRSGDEQVVIVTLGKDGAVAIVGNQRFFVDSVDVSAVDTTGAGDCYVGALAASLTQGRTVREAMDYANAAAAICVQRKGAGPSMPTAEEIGKAFPAVA